ncbi:MAG: GNAT family N-acetyltransferase, partial [Gemmatimonadales bacterium]
MSRSDFHIRPLAGRAEMEACVVLQEAVWGAGFRERVPAAILGVARRLGGVVTGAFRGDELVGFVFGLTGIREGRPVHWSDMLAVRAEARGRGLGIALKEAQRDELLSRGVRVMEWTFDPLVARNAHLNLNRLGAAGVEYVVDAYGDSDSPLHRGIGTDR